MKLAAVFLVILLSLSLAQRPSAKPYNRRIPNDKKSIGMTFQAPPPNDTDKFIQGFIGMILSELKDLHIDSYPVENGEFKNVDIKMSFPKEDGITFRGDPNGDALLFKLHNVKATIDTDMNLEGGTVKGSAVIDIDDMDIDLKTTPISEDGEDHVDIQFHMHLKDADISADVNTLEFDDEMPEGFDLDALIGGMNFKIGAVKMIDEKLEKQTSEILLNYFDGIVEVISYLNNELKF